MFIHQSYNSNYKNSIFSSTANYSDHAIHARFLRFNFTSGRVFYLSFSYKLHCSTKRELVTTDLSISSEELNFLRYNKLCQCHFRLPSLNDRFLWLQIISVKSLCRLYRISSNVYFCMVNSWDISSIRDRLEVDLEQINKK